MNISCTQPTPQPSGQTRSEFYDMIMETFGTSKCFEKTLGFSLALLFRKHLMFHMYNTESCEKPIAFTVPNVTVEMSPSEAHQNVHLRRINPYEIVDLRKFQARAAILANSLGFVNYRKAELNVLSVLDQLKMFCVPENIKCSGEDLDFLVDHLGLSPYDIREQWLENKNSCFCSPNSRENEILSSIYLELLTEKIIASENCSYQHAQKKACETTERELLCGMFRLALEVWTLDYHISGFTHHSPHSDMSREAKFYQTQLNNCLSSVVNSSSSSSSSFQIPSTLQVVMDSRSGKPAVILPKGSRWQTKERIVSSILSKNQGANFQPQTSSSSDEDDDDDDDDRENRTPSQLKNLQAKLDLEYRECADVISELNHPYVQLKMRILIHERKYPANVANRLLTWSLKPSNAVIPFNFLVFLLKRANSYTLSFLLSKLEETSDVSSKSHKACKSSQSGWCSDPFYQQQQQQQQQQKERGRQPQDSSHLQVYLQSY